MQFASIIQVEIGMKNNIILSADEQSLTDILKSKIIKLIGNGSIPVSKYIETALYEKDYGYYNNLLHKFGHEGDFVTAPVMSGLFASCLEIQLRELWKYLPKKVLEIGAGNGQLMIDLLLLMEDEIERYYILELSANLIYVQEQRLQSIAPHLLTKVVWLDALPENFDGVIIANEVLDAQPPEVIIWENNSIYEQHVTVDANKDFVYTNIPIKPGFLLETAKSLPVKSEKYKSEINLNNRGFMKSLAESLNQGCILLIDYGYPENEYYSLNRSNGSLRGFFRHQLLDDILQFPGLIDITTSVDFTCIANIAIENHLDFIGYTTQAGFLLNCGLLDIVNMQRDMATDAQYKKLTSQVDFLTSPNQMGEVFKAIGFSKGIELKDWIGFSQHDRSYTL